MDAVTDAASYRVFASPVNDPTTAPLYQIVTSTSLDYPSANQYGPSGSGCRHGTNAVTAR